MDFCIHFFELLGGSLTEAVEDSRHSGHILDSLNRTYITLVPNIDKPSGFSDYHPISLCNALYKLITKVIADRMKLVLRKVISAKQFSFLLGRQILDAVGTVQESLHSIKMKKLNALF